MIEHLPVAPVVLPALSGAVMILTMRADLPGKRTISIATMLGLGLLAVLLLTQPLPLVYRLGNWPAPFGIVLQIDRLAALLLALNAGLGLAVALYSVGTGWDKRGSHFHALLMFQMMGLNGAFITGDAFNLFVFFEVMLIASYGLMVHGGGAARVKAGVQYVVVNLAGSALFLLALGTIYAVSGTLNMADIGVKAAQVPADGLIRVGAVMLVLVFAVKAAVVPLHFWLPATYENAPGPVAALFAIMTKVGVYAMLRALTLMFPFDGAIGAMLAEGLRIAAGLTLITGMVGLLGARDFGRVISWSVIGSVGTLLLAVTAGRPEATAAGLYYLVHSTLAGASLFLLGDMVLARRGTLALTPGPRLAQGGLLAALTMAAAVAMAGMPPLSGFIGKLLILQALPDQWGLWLLILATSLLAIMGFARAGAAMFWATSEAPHDHDAATHAKAEGADFPVQPLAFVAVGLLIAALGGWTLAAGLILPWLEGVAGDLHSPAGLIRAVLS